MFAEPRKANSSRNEERVYSSSSYDSFGKNGPPPPPDHYSNDGYNKLIVIASPSVNQDQLWKLFDVVPGMDYCQLRYEGDRMRPTRAIAEVVYTNPQWASYAKEKLHGFEYPPGYRLIIRPEYENVRTPFSSKPMADKQKPDILQIAETIAQASSLIQAAGLSPGNYFIIGSFIFNKLCIFSDVLQQKLGFSDLLQQKLGLLSEEKESSSYCNVKLPEPQPFASVDDETAAR